VGITVEAGVAPPAPVAFHGIGDQIGAFSVCDGWGERVGNPVDFKNAAFAVMAHRLTPALVAELLLLRRVVADMAEEGRAARTLQRYREALEAIAALRGLYEDSAAAQPLAGRCYGIAENALEDES
jgi:hypothetical protein